MCAVVGMVDNLNGGDLGREEWDFDFDSVLGVRGVGGSMGVGAVLGVPGAIGVGAGV